MHLEEHGGMCCGIMHIYGFHDLDTDQVRHLDDLLQDYRNQNYGQNYENGVAPEDFNILLEAVLTDGQLVHWSDTLRSRGFRHVTKFYNSNSGNYCNVLHYQPSER